MKPIIEFKSVCKTYDNVTALNNLSFQIPENKIIGLIGANGAGKTTTLKILTRCITTNSGQVHFNNKNILEYPRDKFPIAYLPDIPVFFDELSTLEHLKFISAMHGTEENVSYLIDILDLKKHLDKVPANLSKGNKQKLMIACTLLQNFEVIVADEPFSGLDPRQIEVLKTLLLEQQKMGKVVIISTHLLNMIETFCDYYIMIDDGELLAAGSLQDIVTSGAKGSTIQEIYINLSSIDKDT